MKSVLSTFIGLVVFVCIVAVAGAGINSARNRSGEQQLVVQKRAIERAAVLCYALEGFYPPQIKYLEDKYGLIVDRDKFMVRYSTFGSNIRPEISVHRISNDLEMLDE